MQGVRRPLSNMGGPVRIAGERESGALLAEAFRRAATTPALDLTHGFHSYPGRMHPAIARMLIERLTKPRETVLDPFCGGGTVVLEALVAGRQAIGADLNPLAVRVAEQRCRVVNQSKRKGFERALADVIQRSLRRVREREKVESPLSQRERRWYDPHVLLELAGLHYEIAQEAGAEERRALEMVLSAIVVKFSRQKADTVHTPVSKRLRKGLATEFFGRKGRELVRGWAALEAAVPVGTPPPRILERDIRRLDAVLLGAARPSLILSSPPYGGTYDYVAHHRRRYPWLSLDPSRFERGEIGARRRIGRSPDGARLWENELASVLRTLVSLLAPKGVIVLMLGDGQGPTGPVDAAAQVDRLAQRMDLRLSASASEVRRGPWIRAAQREHLLMLTRS